MTGIVPNVKANLKKVGLIFGICILTQYLHAQQYNFENLTLENGLPQATIYCIFQDSRGYLWFGTEGSGACKYDGKSFHIIDKSSGLAGNIVRSIIEDKSNRLWFGTDAGISVYDGNKFITIDEQKGLSSNTVVTLFIDKSGNLWAGTAGEKGGLDKVSFVSDDSVKISVYDIKKGLSNNNVFTISEDNFSRLWIGTFGGGITILPEEGKGNAFVLNRQSNFISDHILTITPDNLNTMWVGTYDMGVFKVPVTKNLNINNIEHLSNSNNTTSNTVWSILPGDHDIWIGTNESGILRFANKKAISISTSNGLLKNQIVSIFKDRENNIWISSGDAGISRFLGDRFYHITKKEGLQEENVCSIVQDGNGITWIGTYGGGLFRISHEGAGYKMKVFSKPEGLPDNVINSMSVDKGNNLWIATSNGIARFNGKDFRIFNEEKDGLVNNDVNTILVDKRGIVWCGTKKGVSIYDGTGFKNTKDNLLPNNEIQALLEDKKGNLWCGTLGGLAKFQGNKLTTYDEMEGLIQKKVYCLAEDKQGNIWVGTFGGGIFRLSTNQTGKTHINQMVSDSLLASNNIYSLLFENDTTLISGTDKGMSRIFLTSDLNIKSVYNYGFREGFSGIKNNVNAISAIGDEIWLGTVKGITIYRPEFDIPTTATPEIQITDLKLFFNDVDWKNKGYKIIPWTRLPFNPKLSYRNNHLTFHYTGLFFSDKEEISYRYKLEGFDNDWSPPRKENEALYPGLPPGDFTFKVIASDRSNTKSSKIAIYHFIITPPFWKTTWFYVACVIALASLIIVYIKYRERKLRAERDRLEQVVTERTAEVVKQKNLIENQRDEIQKQHNIVIEQKKDIMDSIQYAKRIQTAAIPSEEWVRHELQDLFILYKPRDIVSGDFYWFGVEDQKIIVIAADCTGHGVPGAFTSMLGISMLNDIIGKESTTSPEIILNELRKNIISSLKQSVDGDSKDGMDIAIITIDKDKMMLDFAGAMNPLFIIRESNSPQLADSWTEGEGFRLYEIKGDKMPAAIHVRLEPFNKVSVRIMPGDRFYLLSDGFEDQFGGPDHRKFMRKNLKKVLLQIQNLPMVGQKEYLERTFDEWKGELPQVDDIMIIGFTI